MTTIFQAPALTQERLWQCLHYDPRTGIFHIACRRQGLAKAVGDVAGSLRGDGYIDITIDGERFKASRLAWFYVTGRWPSGEIDHKNRNRSDNRWINLREATIAEQRQNQSIRRDSKVGLKGVSFMPKKNRFRARIMVDGRYLTLGQGFRTAAEAYGAYADAKARLHPFNPKVDAR